MLITKIEKQKNNEKRYSVFLDYEFAFGIDEIDLLYFKLKENEILEKEKYEYILNNLLLKKAKDKALKYLAYKIRTEKQVREKLLQEEFPEIIIEKVIKILKKYNYINDENYAKAFIKDKLNVKGYGIFKITYELKIQGISEEIFKKYLDDTLFFDEQQKAIELLRKKVRKINEIDYKEKQKLYSYLARRGFSFDTINNSLNIVLEEMYE